MMTENIKDLKVQDKKTFIKFLNLLHQDYLENPNSWENNNISTFLEAMISYTEDIDGYYKNTNQDINLEKPTWQVFADILKGSSIYE